MSDLLRSLVIVGSTVAGVTLVTLGLIGAIAPDAAARAEPTSTPEPTFDLSVAPDTIGGRLEVTGDRTGTLVLDAASGTVTDGRYEAIDDGSVMIRPPEDWVLHGPDGRITFKRSSGEVRHIGYDGLSFYLDPDQCTVTLGELNLETGLMAALIECPEIADVRDQGVISIVGVVALPVDVLRGRGELPPTGGTVDVAGTTLTFDEADIFLGGEALEETGRIPWAIFTGDLDFGIGLEYDPEADEFFLTAFIGQSEYTMLSEPCPVTAEALGTLNEVTTVVRLDIRCVDVAVPGGGLGSVTGTLVADVIEDFVESAPAAP